MTTTRALIEAAEEVLNIWAMPRPIYLKLRAAISSAKAAEETTRCKGCGWPISDSVEVREKEGL